jgi:ABC-type uncharacterized transport system fused permease/ATPase subunit
LLIQKPDVILMDDALAALDEPSQLELEGRIAARLPGVTLISFSQRPRALLTDIVPFEIDRKGAVPVISRLEPEPA